MSLENCDSVRSEIRQRVRTPAILAHLVTCASCRAYALALNRIDGLARRSGLSAPPALASLGDAPPHPRNAMEKKRSSLYPALGITAAALIGVALLARQYVLSPPPEVPAIARKRPSVPRPETWHFVGWRMVGKEKKRWEIWGQRKPVFYREQLGDDLLITENDFSLRYVAPREPGKKGVILIDARINGGAGGPYNHGTLTYRVDPLEDWTRFSRSLSKSKEILSQNAATMTVKTPFAPLTAPTMGMTMEANGLQERATVVLNRQTGLPTRIFLEWKGRSPYQSQTVVNGASADSDAVRPKGELNLTYGLAIPEQVRTIDPPPGTPIVDRRLPVTIRESEKEIAAPGSTVVDIQVTGRDADGHLLLRIKGWGGGKNLADLPTQFYLSPLPDADRTYSGGNEILFRDDVGNDYISLGSSGGFSDFGQSDRIMIPLEPGSKKGNPRSATLKAQVAVFWNDHIPDELPQVYFNSDPSSLDLTLPLPAVVSRSLTLPVNDRGPNGLSGPNGLIPIRPAAALARVRYYFNRAQNLQGRMDQASRSSEGDPVPYRKAMEEAMKRCRFWLASARRDASRPGMTEPARQALLRECDNLTLYLKVLGKTRR
ncbi:MAG: hypothetical protein SFU56_13055 [Capsulimonadales bacterium]|nr:hypothetical protein [Capsulimonadales bacterium]